MPMSSQFALTLELTSLIPLNLIRNASQNALLSLARQLRNSGSDIIIEQDLTQLFGRSRITSQMDSTFRALVSYSSNTPLTNEINILSGAGPTVVRAFQERPYFATLVQLSLLTWVHETYSLAQKLVDILEMKCEHAPQEYLSPPDPRGVAGTLTVCEEQTSMLDWDNYLNAIAAMLELDRSENAHDPMGTSVLRGLLDMLPLVQTLPLDRMIHVETCTGFCVIVAWAHNVLGLTVKVKTLSGRQVNFGGGPEQVYIEYSEKTSCVEMYDSSGDSNEILFRITPDVIDEPIGVTYRTPLRGYGKMTFLKADFEPPYFSPPPALLQDMIAITVAFCRLIHGSLESGNGRFVHSQPNRSAENRILEVASILFDTEITEASISPYVNNYRARPLDSNLAIPASLSTIPHDKLPVPVADVWTSLIRHAQDLATLLLFLAYVNNLSDCERLRLPSISSIQFHDFTVVVGDWNGCAPITMREGTVFEFILALIDEQYGDKNSSDLRSISLVSRHGWTLYLASFSDEDPAAVEVEKVRIIRGVPYRNDVRVNCVTDAYLSHSGEPIQVAGPGDVLTHPYQSQIEVTRGKTMFSQQNNSVAATFLFHARPSGTEDAEQNFRRAAYRSLHRSLWRSRPCQACTHSSTSCKIFELPLDCAAFVGFPTKWGEGVNVEDGLGGVRVAIYLTEKKVQARWSVMTENLHEEIGEFAPPDQTKLVLRTNNCCIPCAVAQAASMPGRWRVIL